jgi:hypothetical protein
VRLELDRIGSGIRNGINVGVSHAKAAIMSLRDFTNDKTWRCRIAPEVGNVAWAGHDREIKM